jgi:DNA excision repair protein ERCC-4
MSAASKSQSYWMLQEAGEHIFRLAKERVYRLITATTGNNQPVVKLKRILEHKPKEILLHQVLTEIENQWNRKLEVARDTKYPVPSSANGNVLLMVKDERALRSVRTYLTHGDGVNRAAAQNFLSYLDQVQKQVKPMIRPGGLDLNSMSTEQRLLFEEHSRVYNILFGSDKMDQNKRIAEDDSRELTHWKTRQRKIVEEKARGAAVADTIHQQFYLDAAVKTSTLEAKFPKIYSENESTDEGSVGSWSSDDEDEVAFKVGHIEGLKLFIRTFSQVEEGEASILLHDIRPDYVVMYDSDPSFIRTLEIYSNSMENPSASSVELSKKDRLRVYFLLYEASAEDSNFLTSLEREKEAFDRLIEHTKRMPTTLSALDSFSTQEMLQSCGGVGGSYANGTLPLSMDTRTGGGKQKAAQERRDIAVDVREFRAALPSILHQGGMRLAPVTLTVGDFVLSNVHVVERKSISDLHGSFNNGRLKDQVKAMAKYYKCPCLLIEFDPEKNFALQTSSDLGAEIRVDAITSKLAMLTMTFPMLRILWSRSPHETLKIFKKLKRNHQEVDVDKAVEIGNNESLDDLLVGGKEGYYNEGEEDYDENDDAAVNDVAKSMLLRLPGVNFHNARKIMSECDSIASLARLSREELRRIAGPVAGQKLFTFFRDRLEV